MTVVCAGETERIIVEGASHGLPFRRRRDRALAPRANRAKRCSRRGIDEDGTKHLLGLLPCTKEDTASCRDFLRDLKARQLVDPLRALAYGTPGLIRAAEEVSPRIIRQPCLRHKMRNLRSKVPEERAREIFADSPSGLPGAEPGVGASCSRGEPLRG